MNIEEKIKSEVRNVPDFPKEGIMFRDITSLLKDPQGLKQTVDELAAKYETYSGDNKIDIIHTHSRIPAIIAYFANLKLSPRSCYYEVCGI